MTPLIVIRPQPGADTTASAAAALGLDARAFPLFEVGPVDWEPPDPAQIDALLIGSANAVRHAGPALDRFRAKPVYAVGKATAAACRDAGLSVAATGSGGLDAVLAEIAGHPRLLRLAGREHVALHPPPSVELTERIIYASAPRPLPVGLPEMLRSPAIVALHSATAAEHFAAECDRLALDRAKLSLVTIGPRVTAACGTGWAEVATAEAPEDAALLARARQLCQNRAETPIDGARSKAGMPDENLIQPTTLPHATPRAFGSGRALIAVGLLAFVLGAALVGWIAWRSGLTLERVLGGESAGVTVPVAPPGPASLQLPPLSADPVVAQGAFDQRIGALEQRLARLDLQAQAVAGNTARAEGLLIAFAVRRMIDRGSPLGYLEDQLRVRFADAQPNAVATLIEAARNPVTLDQLETQLQAMAPALAQVPRDDSSWRRVTREVSSLFVIRSDDRPAQNPARRIDRALLLLREGQVAGAITEVRKLPGAAEASGWLAAAQRHLAAQRALDLIESTALIETNQFSDAAGQPVQTPSPLIPPPAPVGVGGP
jgi:uroporphyrinogen-III synthase